MTDQNSTDDDADDGQNQYGGGSGDTDATEQTDLREEEVEVPTDDEGGEVDRPDESRGENEVDVPDEDAGEADVPPDEGSPGADGGEVDLPDEDGGEVGVPGTGDDADDEDGDEGDRV